MCRLVDYAVAMRLRLEDVNIHSFNNFDLRVGISCGPLVGGVIGARKPVFDIWGNTVNEASRMDSTGVMGKIQVPRDIARVSKDRKIAKSSMFPVDSDKTWKFFEKNTHKIKKPAKKCPFTRKTLKMLNSLNNRQYLESHGYQTQKRGLIEVKGKGTMETYFVLGQSDSAPEGVSRHRSACRSLAAVVYGVVQARRKQMRAIRRT